MTDIPIGTGTLYVLNREHDDPADQSQPRQRKRACHQLDDEMIDAFIPFKSRKRTSQSEPSTVPSTQNKSTVLVSEHRKINSLEREESFVVQYLALGGIRHFLSSCINDPKPFLAASSVHSGAGQQTFGYSVGQRADLMLAFHDKQNDKTILSYHNYHGHMWHYIGHLQKCPLNVIDQASFVEREISVKMDQFKKELSLAWSAVRPDKLIFDYSVSYACQMFHGLRVPSLDNTDTTFYCVKECLLNERKNESWFPRSERVFEHETLKQGIRDGSATGFVTLKGGKEKQMGFTDPSGTRFGFCVQAYAPTPNDISSYTKSQIARFYTWGNSFSESETCDKKVNGYISAQPARTINSGTFHSDTTISTTYLQWLMVDRNFDDFEMTHFLAYEFRDWNKDFLEPVLQRRHECKQQGNTVAAECLKLIGNGSFGYNGLESSNYDTVHLLTEVQLSKKLQSGASLHHRKLKPIIRLGVVEISQKAKKSRNERRGRRRKTSFSLSEASEGSESESEGESNQFSEGENDANSVHLLESHPLIPDASDLTFNYSHYKEWRQNMRKGTLAQRSLNTPLLNMVSSQLVPPPSGDRQKVEMAIEKHSDHTYAAPFCPPMQKKSTSFSYHFLYLVTVSGEEKRIFNNLPKAVGVLSNSKRLFLGHLSTMFQCLDPCLAELTYVDTDSCIWSLSMPNLVQCLRPDKKQLWNQKQILADETGSKSCHGKMKLEGTFVAGQFRTVKIYRLYKEEEEKSGNEEESLKLQPAYTRCKGVNRYIATKLPNQGFDSQQPENIVVHRNALRPTKTGEIHIVHEARSVSCPFNLKRFVCDDGYHTVPFFYNCNE